MKNEELVKCPNRCFDGQVKIESSTRALFDFTSCKFCNGTGKVKKSEYKSIDKSI
jgi:hypothetical protein